MIFSTTSNTFPARAFVAYALPIYAQAQAHASMRIVPLVRRGALLWFQLFGQILQHIAHTFLRMFANGADKSVCATIRLRSHGRAVKFCPHPALRATLSDAKRGARVKRWLCILPFSLWEKGWDEGKHENLTALRSHGASVEQALLSASQNYRFAKALFPLVIALMCVFAPSSRLLAQENTAGNTLNDTQAERLFAQANDAYKSANYKQATALYEQLVQSGVEASQVYFNLGNCYYKSGKIASAILNYHRAQRLDPTDEDIEFNLSLAESRIADKIDPAPQFFIVKWWRLLVGLQIASVWSGVGVSFVWVLFVAAGIFFAANSPALKKAMFTTGIVSVIIIALMFIFAYRQHKTTMRDESAIVFASSVAVKSEPQEESKDLFTLHEGTHIEILGGDGAWCKIRIADGSVGWLRRNTIQVI